MINYLIESFDKATVDYELRLVVVARQNVTNGSEAGDNNRNRLMIEQFYQFFQQIFVQKVIDVLLGSV